MSQALRQGQETPGEHKSISLPQEASDLTLRPWWQYTAITAISNCCTMLVPEHEHQGEPFLGRSGDAGHNLLLMNVLKVTRNRIPNSSLSQEQWGFISPHSRRSREVFKSRLTQHLVYPEIHLSCPPLLIPSACIPATGWPASLDFPQPVGEMGS